MKNLIIILSLLSAIISFYSCENEIEFNGDEKSSMMVINGFFTPDSLLKIHVSKSKFFLKDDSSFDNITNATVQLWVNDVLKGEMDNAGDGFYTFNYFPNAGDVIKVSASNGVYNNVYSFAEIPHVVPILSLDTSSVELEDGYSTTYTSDGNTYRIDTVAIIRYTQFNVRLTFDEPANQDNYYELGLRLRLTYDDNTTEISPVNIYSEDIVFGSGASESDLIDTGNYNQYYEFNDELISGKTHTLSFYKMISNTIYMPDYEPGTNPGDGVEVKSVVKKEYIVDLRSISKSYYLYLKSRDAAYNVVDFFSEPVQIHNNIVGGIGILGGYTVNSKVIEIPLGYESDYYY